jgi:ectoine hydroxylase-related dioxygenase (phytanoyl-CoA dioxygenase family)
MTHAGACAAILQDGFAIIPDVFVRERMDILLEEIVKADPRRSRAGIRHALSVDAVACFAKSQELANLAHKVLGQNAFPFRATLFDKSFQSNWLVVWHQDTALPLRTRLESQGWGPWSVKEGVPYAHAPATALDQVLALRVHCHDSTFDNGPLRILPGTHTRGVLTDDAIHELSTRITPVDCIVQKGGVVAMKPLVVHASSKSRTEMPRAVLHIEYAASHSIADPHELAVA